jgi:hypothetical protein
MDRGMGKQLQNALKKQGLTVPARDAVTKAERTEQGVRVTLESKGQSSVEEADVVLGRDRPPAVRRGPRRARARRRRSTTAAASW